MLLKCTMFISTVTHFHRCCRDKLNIGRKEKKSAVRQNNEDNSLVCAFYDTKNYAFFTFLRVQKF